jgi:hypothetical protein
LPRLTPAEQAERITATVMLHSACRAGVVVSLSLAVCLLKAHAEHSRSAEYMKDMEVEMRNMAVNEARLKAEYLQLQPGQRAEVEHLHESLECAEVEIHRLHEELDLRASKEREMVSELHKSKKERDAMSRQIVQVTRQLKTMGR